MQQRNNACGFPTKTRGQRPAIANKYFQLVEVAVLVQISNETAPIGTALRRGAWGSQRWQP